MATEISNSDDIIDSRDVIARIGELESDFETLTEAVDEAREELMEAREAVDDAQSDLDADLGADDDREEAIVEASNLIERRYDAVKEAEASLATAEKDLAEWGGEEELKVLKAFANEAEGYSDWDYGETLIRESYFVEYAQELAEDCGDYNSRDVKWPYTCIDWEQAAQELLDDYASIEFDNITYYLRA